VRSKKSLTSELENNSFLVGLENKSSFRGICFYPLSVGLGLSILLQQLYGLTVL
jgi:hypothetical protein